MNDEIRANSSFCECKVGSGYRICRFFRPDNDGSCQGSDCTPHCVHREKCHEALEAAIADGVMVQCDCVNYRWPFASCDEYIEPYKRGGRNPKARCRDCNHTYQCHEDQHRKKKERLMEKTKNAAIKSAKAGGGLAASRRANQLLIAKVREAMGDKYPEALDTPGGKLVEPLIIPILLHYVAVSVESVPHAAKVEAVCEFAMTSAFEDLSSALLDKLLPVFEEVAKISRPKPPA